MPVAVTEVVLVRDDATRGVAAARLDSSAGVPLAVYVQSPAGARPVLIDDVTLTSAPLR